MFVFILKTAGLVQFFSIEIVYVKIAKMFYELQGKNENRLYKVKYAFFMLFYKHEFFFFNIIFLAVLRSENT